MLSRRADVPSTSMEIDVDSINLPLSTSSLPQFHVLPFQSGKMNAVETDNMFNFGQPDHFGIYDFFLRESLQNLVILKKL
ncbi:hypothetical protein M0804_012597 [Polistes exclamans]|nr:hypothetical protein M0804_012597 [Polistes exclamans]